MKYDYILVRYGEIALKGKNRHRFEDKLAQNIRNVLKSFEGTKVIKTYGRIFVDLNGNDSDQVMERMKNVFGIVSISPVKKAELDMEEIKETALAMMKELDPFPNTYKIETKRPNKYFPLSSPEVTQEVGAHILSNIEGLKVDVHNPDIKLNIEIRHEGVFLFLRMIKGIGGMPAGTSGKGMVLLSGGIDSPVAAYSAMKRGLAVEGIHFHTHPLTTEQSLQKVLDLGKIVAKFSGTFRLHFVPFYEIQMDIKKNAQESYNITIMRRMFYRIAEKLAEQRGALALITGESLGQVASQTLESMYTINHVIKTPVIRPLVTMDKLEIIDIAQKIGTFETSILPHEDCCSLFVPKSPVTRPTTRRAEFAEQNMNFDLIDIAIEKTRSVTLTPNSNIKAMDILFADILNKK